MVGGRASRPGMRVTFILLNSWASLLPNCLAHSPFPASWIPRPASEAGPSIPPLILAPGPQLLLKGLGWKDNRVVTWSKEFSGDRLDPRLLGVPCGTCPHVWERKAGTCWNLQMDSEHTGFKRSPGGPWFTLAPEEVASMPFLSPIPRTTQSLQPILLWNK